MQKSISKTINIINFLSTNSLVSMIELVDEKNYQILKSDKMMILISMIFSMLSRNSNSLYLIKDIPYSTMTLVELIINYNIKSSNIFNIIILYEFLITNKKTLKINEDFLNLSYDETYLSYNLINEKLSFIDI